MLIKTLNFSAKKFNYMFLYFRTKIEGIKKRKEKRRRRRKEREKANILMKNINHQIKMLINLLR